MSNLSNQCNCPICRLQRREITRSEVAWYLKGKIEARNADLRMKVEGKFGHDHDLYKSYESYLRCTSYDDEYALNEIIKSFGEEGSKIDSAFLHPKDFIPEEG